MRSVNTNDINKNSFEQELRVIISYLNNQVRGEGQAPWEAVMEFLIHLEKRVKELESNHKKRQ